MTQEKCDNIVTEYKNWLNEHLNLAEKFQPQVHTLLTASIYFFSPAPFNLSLVMMTRTNEGMSTK